MCIYILFFLFLYVDFFLFLFYSDLRALNQSRKLTPPLQRREAGQCPITNRYYRTQLPIYDCKTQGLWLVIHTLIHNSHIRPENQEPPTTSAVRPSQLVKRLRVSTTALSSKQTRGYNAAVHISGCGNLLNATEISKLTDFRLSPNLYKHHAGARPTVETPQAQP